MDPVASQRVLAARVSMIESAIAIIANRSPEALKALTAMLEAAENLAQPASHTEEDWAAVMVAVMHLRSRLLDPTTKPRPPT